MNWNQPQLRLPKPTTDSKGRRTRIEVHGTDEFMALCKRADAGELRVIYWENAIGFTEAGFPAGNGDWVFRVRWEDAKTI